MPYENNHTKVEEMLSTRFNPAILNSDEDEAIWREEYWDTHAILRAQLEGKWRYDPGFADSSGDFTMNDDYGNGRFLAVEVRTKKMLNKELIEGMKAFLAKLPTAYCIYVDCDIDNDCDEVTIIITKDNVIGSIENPKTARKLGFR